MSLLQVVDTLKTIALEWGKLQAMSRTTARILRNKKGDFLNLGESQTKSSTLSKSQSLKDPSPLVASPGNRGLGSLDTLT